MGTISRMKSVRLLQLGDVHYPDAITETLADLKDPSFPSGFADQMLLNPLQRVLRTAAKEHQDEAFDGILLCGDLTTRGDVPGYEHCVDWLNKVFSLDKWKKDKVHIVPGNHDVKRDRIDPAGLDLLAKFAPFKAVWESRGLPELTVETLRTTRITSAKNSVAVFSVNSSIGCGEKRHLPKSVADDLFVLLAKVVSRDGLEAAFSLVGETLDSPGFREVDIDAACASIAQVNRRTVPVFLAHHNLLPQALLRLQIYTEVMNAGHVRSRLSRLERSILYCHGHIHDDPIEIVSGPDNPRARIISVSAPELKKGFNVIKIEYSVTGAPLGCRIRRSQISSRDGAMLAAEKSVPFHQFEYKSARAIAHPKLPLVLATLPESELRFEDAVENIESSRLLKSSSGKYPKSQ